MDINLLEVIMGLANSIENDENSKNKETINTLFQKYKENPALYAVEIQMMFLNMTRFSAMPWLAEHPEIEVKNRFIIEMIFNGTLPHYVRKIIEKNEGTCCSGDKESFVINQVKIAIATNTNRTLYQTYDGCKQIDKSKWNEKAYWSPTSFKDTDDVIQHFMDWYNVK